MRSLAHFLRIAAAAAMLFLSLTTPPVSAYTLMHKPSTGWSTASVYVPCDYFEGFAHWNTAVMSWRLNTANQGAGKGNAIQSAMTAWVNVPDADHTPVYAGVTADGFALDGRNTMVWASGNGCSVNCLAMTAVVVQAGQVIVESDITFNNNYTWATNGTDYDVEAVVAHELGHSLGIGHTYFGGGSPPTMKGTYSGVGDRSLEPDDWAALQCVQSRYPVSAPPIPPVPASLTVEPALCLGWVDLIWADSPGATSYQLQQSLSSTFSNVVTIYDGPNTWLSPNGTGTRYFRVRACNLVGCSAWRNGDRSAPYYSTCL